MANHTRSTFKDVFEHKDSNSDEESVRSSHFKTGICVYFVCDFSFLKNDCNKPKLMEGSDFNLKFRDQSQKVSNFLNTATYKGLLNMLTKGN